MSIWTLSPHLFTSTSSITLLIIQEDLPYIHKNFQTHFSCFVVFFNAIIYCSGGSVILLMRYWIPSSNLWNCLKDALHCRLHLIIIPLYDSRHHTTLLLFLQLLLQRADKPYIPEEIMLYPLVMSFHNWSLTSLGNGGGHPLLLLKINQWHCDILLHRAG